MLKMLDLIQMARRGEIPPSPIANSPTSPREDSHG